MYVLQNNVPVVSLLHLGGTEKNIDLGKPWSFVGCRTSSESCDKYLQNVLFSFLNFGYLVSKKLFCAKVVRTPKTPNALRQMQMGKISDTDFFPSKWLWGIIK